MNIEVTVIGETHEANISSTHRQRLLSGPGDVAPQSTVLSLSVGVVTVGDKSAEASATPVEPAIAAHPKNEMEITMQLDCATCPGRPRACDGCMMTVFIAAPTTRNDVRGLTSVDATAALEADSIHMAIDAFVDAGMVGASAHDLPIARERGGQGLDGRQNVRRLRAS